MITFLVAKNIPLISHAEITQRFLSFSGMVASEVDIRADAKNSRICSVRVRFIDAESAQRCCDTLKGHPFSPHHDVGPVQGIAVKQMSKEEQMQWAMQERKEKEQQQMRRSLLLNGLTDEERAGLMAMAAQQQQILPDTQHISIAPNSKNTPVAVSRPSNNKKQAAEVPMMQQVTQPLHGQPHQVLQPYHGGMPQNMQPQPQLMMVHNMMPPPPQPVPFYQQQPIQLQQQQQYIQVAPQQMHQQQVHQFPQAQHMPVQYTTVQHIPVQQYQYQMQQPVMQYHQPASPTAAELQRLDDEERINQERMSNLMKQAGQR
jgi:hypothetical protein